VRQVKEQELAESVRDFGRNMRDSLERCGLNLSLPKTHLCFALGDLELFSKTWPRWGIMLNGECSELGMSVRHISETECGSWLTPRAMEVDESPENFRSRMNSKRKNDRKNGFGSLTMQVKVKEGMWPTPRSCSAMAATITPESSHDPKRFPNLETVVGQRTWPTPTSSEHKELGGTPIQPTYVTPRVTGTEHYKTVETRKGAEEAARHNTLASVQVQHHNGEKTAQLNPSWVEWLMGWPIGWTDLKPLVTDKFRNVQLWHSLFSQKD